MGVVSKLQLSVSKACDNPTHLPISRYRSAQTEPRTMDAPTQPRATAGDGRTSSDKAEGPSRRLERTLNIPLDCQRSVSAPGLSCVPSSHINSFLPNVLLCSRSLLACDVTPESLNDNVVA